MTHRDKEKKRLNNKTYYDKHREEIIAKKKKKNGIANECICGATYKIAHKAEHERMKE